MFPLLGLELTGGAPHHFGSPDVYCGNVRDVHFFGHSYIKHQDQFVVDNQCFALDPERNGFDAYASLTDKRPSNIYTEPAEMIFLGGTWHDPIHNTPPNFGHFLFEFASRLAIFDRYDLLHLPAVVYQNVPQRWVDFLRLAGIKSFFYADPENSPNYGNIWTASCPFQRDQNNDFYMWQPAIHWLRNKLLKNIDVRPKRKLYMGRTTAKWRKPVNEDEVLKLLTSNGFTIMEPGDLSAEDQIRLMAESEIIVACAGAGTIITQFAPEHCKVIVLQPYQTGGYWGGWGHAIHLRQLYQRVGCEPVEVSGMDRRNVFGTNELVDYRVDLKILQQLLEAA